MSRVIHFFLAGLFLSNPLFATGETVRVLSINGGGIRGVVPAVILDEISKQTKLHPSDQFDLITGTSIGGIISLALTTPDSHNKPLLQTSDVLDLFSPANASKIFQTSFYKRWVSFFGLWDEKYDATGLEGLLKEKLSDMPLSRSLTPVMATSFELESYSPVFFKSWKASQFREHDYLRWQVGRATSAAPVYFEPIGFGSLENQGTVRHFIDGGVVANNPSMAAYAEAKRLYPDADKILLVSIDTGSTKKTISGVQAKSWGAAKWAMPLMDIMFSGLDAIPDYQLKQFLKNDTKIASEEESYFHFATQISSENSSLDDVRPENIEGLKKSARQTIRDNQEQFDAVCRTLSSVRQSKK